MAHKLGPDWRRGEHMSDHRGRPNKSRAVAWVMVHVHGNKDGDAADVLEGILAEHHGQ
jgi:hypothetical protein